jgi:hypothetical protein
MDSGIGVILPTLSPWERGRGEGRVTTIGPEKQVYSGASGGSTTLTPTLSQEALVSTFDH